MRILMTGATGFIGKALGKKLFESGHSLVVLSRNASRARHTLPFACDTYSWQPTEELPPEESTLNIDGVIHLAGESVVGRRWSQTQKKRIRDSRILSTRNLIKGFLRNTSSLPKVFICSSAIGYYGETFETEITESAPAGTDFLAEVCQDWENEVIEGLKDTSIREVRIRTGIVLGEEGGMLEKVLPIFKLGLGGRLGSGEQWMSWIHRDDLIQIYYSALKQENLRGPVNGTSPSPVRNIDFTKTLAKALKKPAIFPVPKVALQITQGEVAQVILASQKVLPKALMDSEFRFQFSQLDQAIENIV